MHAEATRHRPSVGILPRLVSLCALTTLLAGITYVAVTGYRALADAWVAPINLSPDSDKVIDLTLKWNKTMAERALLEAELERIDGEIAAVDIAIGKLSRMQTGARDAILWSADVQGEQSKALNGVIANLTKQRTLLLGLVETQEEMEARAKKNLAAGLITEPEYRKEQQALQQLRLSLTENQRQTQEARLRLRESDVASDALRADLEGGSAEDANAPRGQMPEVLQRREQEIRIELEIVKLQAERRGLGAFRKVAVDSLAKMDELIAQIQARPLYQAMQKSTDIAFIPYDQLDGVSEGDEVISCTLSLFRCRVVGRMGEIVPGEVVTQDPWGDLARGQYALLEMHDPLAFREKTLRVRKAP